MNQVGCGSFLAMILVLALCAGLLIGCTGKEDEILSTEPLEKTMTVTVMSSFPGLEAVDATGFYCMDESQQLWRIEWSNASELQGGKKYTVCVKDYAPQEPAESGWSPKFKGTAVSVTPLA